MATSTQVDDHNLKSGGGGGSGVTIHTVKATAQDVHTGNSAFEDIDSMSITFTPSATATVIVYFTAVSDFNSSNWEHMGIQFDLDAGSEIELWSPYHRSAAPVALNRRMPMHHHHIFTGVSAAEHTIKMVWSDNFSSQDTDFFDRRLTLMVIE